MVADTGYRSPMEPVDAPLLGNRDVINSDPPSSIANQPSLSVPSTPLIWENEPPEIRPDIAPPVSVPTPIPIPSPIVQEPTFRTPGVIPPSSAPDPDADSPSGLDPRYYTACSST